MFITAAATISHQPTFRNNGFSADLSALKEDSQLMEPDYSGLIPAMIRRRMSEVIKMGIACSVDCLEQAGITQPDGIIVGTSMGCSIHTRNFLDKIFEAEDGPLSPTSFIVSTHNTIAGQISLLLNNHNYNMTYTHNTLSFEHSLTDAIMCMESGSTAILVGGADEEESAIYNMKERLGNDRVHLTGGASFFILSDKKSGSSAVRLADVGSFGLIKDRHETITRFLEANGLSPEKIDLVLYSTVNEKDTAVLEGLFDPQKIFDYQTITGTYYTNAAFAMHFGIDILTNVPHPVFRGVTNHILVCNNLISENLGLILLSK